MGNNKELEVCFTGETPDANIASCVHPVNSTDSSQRWKKQLCCSCYGLWTQSTQSCL